LGSIRANRDWSLNCLRFRSYTALPALGVYRSARYWDARGLQYCPLIGSPLLGSTALPTLLGSSELPALGVFRYCPLSGSSELPSQGLQYCPSLGCPRFGSTALPYPGVFRTALSWGLRTFRSWRHQEQPALGLATSQYVDCNNLFR